jgi:hypothetical protein
MFAIRRVFCTLSRRPSPVPKKRSRALSRNDRIMGKRKAAAYNRQVMPYEDGDVGNDYNTGFASRDDTSSACLQRPQRLQDRVGPLRGHRTAAGEAYIIDCWALLVSVSFHDTCDL